MNIDYSVVVDAPPAADCGHFFEGPEKRMEMWFTPSAHTRSEGLRFYNADRWQELLNHAKCTIISHKQNEFFDAYVLSESSLFVYPTKVMLKTCGSTTLLRAIPTLLQYAAALAMTPELIVYSHKNFLRPHRQETVHHSFDGEVELLQSHFDNLGHSYVFGPTSAEHWFVYYAELSALTRTNSSSSSSNSNNNNNAADSDMRGRRPEQQQRQPSPSPTSNGSGNQSPMSQSPVPMSSAAAPSMVTVEIMMHHLSRDARSRFFGKRDCRELPEVEKLIPGSDIDHFHFEPCGYSMNGLYENSHSTIHVTPEADFSYASYETTLMLPSYRGLVSAVFDLFRPGVATVTMVEHQPSESERVRENLTFPDYQVRNQTVTYLEGGRKVSIWNFRALDCVPSPTMSRPVSTSSPPPEQW